MSRSSFSVTRFFERFPNEAACLEKIVEHKWGDHKPCPRCGKAGGWKPIGGTKKYRHPCGLHQSVLKGTAFFRSNLSLMAYFYALLLFANSTSGIRSTFIRKQLGIGLRAAHRLCNTIRLHMAAYDRPVGIGGPGKTVHIDELYLQHSFSKGTPKRLAAIVLGFACEGKVLCGIIPNRKSETLLVSIERWVLPGSKIITDDYSSYRRVPSLGFEHVSVNHSKGVFSDRRGNSTCEIEAYWASVRRALRLYHQVSENNLWLFLAEIEFRYNHRFQDSSPFEALTSTWADLDAVGAQELRNRYDWTSLTPQDRHRKKRRAAYALTN